MAELTLQQLQARLARLASSAVAFAGIVYRSSTPKYATETDLLTGEGSRRLGGRWNPKGIAALYASLTPETAMAEALAHHRYYGIPIENAMPRTFVALEVQLKTVLDLRVSAVRRNLHVSLTKACTVDWRTEVKVGRVPITQRLGWAAYAEGWEAVIVPSAADPNGHNLLIFPDRLGGASVVSLVNPDRLAEP